MIAWLLGLGAVVAATLVAVEGLARRPLGVRRVSGMVLVGLCVAAAILLVPLAWAFRDGIGPDAVQSAGREAVRNTLELMLPPLAVLIPVFAFGAWMAYGGQRRRAAA